MRTFKTLFFIAAASLAITSCKKNDVKQSNTQLLTDNPWVIVKFEEKQNNGAWTDIFPYIDACSKDDKWIFKTNLSLDMTEGLNACSGNMPNEVLDSTTWSFLDNETKLKVESDVFKIEQLNASTMVISYSEVNGGITEYTKITMGH